MVAGNVIGRANQPVTAREIVKKYKQLVHDKIVSQIVWSGDNRPNIQTIEAVEVALGGGATFESKETINLGPRQSVSIIAVAGGGGGGHGRKDRGGPTGDRTGFSGTNTKFEIRAGSPTGTLIKSYDLAGGTGGASAAVSYSNPPYPGNEGGNVTSKDPNYGRIGTGGSARPKSGAYAASGFGAGGGGSWGDMPSFFDPSGNGGRGGAAGEFKEETVDTSGHGTSNIFLVITQIGTGGKGAVGGRNSSGNGGPGMPGVVFLKEEKPATLTSNGPTFDEDGLIDSILGDDHLGLGRKIDGDKIYEVFLQKTNEYTQIRKLQVIGTDLRGNPYNETEVAFMNANFRENINTSGVDIVNSENELDPGDLNEDEDIVTYFNNLYDAWRDVRDVPIINGSASLTAGVLPTFNSSTGEFSVSIKNTTVYTISQTFTPTKLETVAFLAIGGGGGDGNYYVNGSSGGGGGGIAMKILRVAPGQSYTFTVGKPGSGNNAGTNSSVVGGGLTLVGGGGGAGTDVHGSGNAATNGGQASGGDYNFEGGGGAPFRLGGFLLPTTRTSGGPAGGSAGSSNTTDVVLSDFFSAFVQDNGKTLAGSGSSPGTNGLNYGGGAGARPSSGSGQKSGSIGCIAIIRFN